MAVDTCGRAEGGRLALEALEGPIGIARMGTRHALGHGRVSPAQTAAPMNGNALALMEDLDRAGGQARLDLLSIPALLMTRRPALKASENGPPTNS